MSSCFPFLWPPRLFRNESELVRDARWSTRRDQYLEISSVFFAIYQTCPPVDRKAWRGGCAQLISACLTICLRHVPAWSPHWLLLRMLLHVAEARPLCKGYESFTGVLLRLGRYIWIATRLTLLAKWKPLESNPRWRGQTTVTLAWNIATLSCMPSRSSLYPVSKQYTLASEGRSWTFNTSGCKKHP